MSAPEAPFAPASIPSYDPGLTNEYTGSLKRVVKKDGGFNVRRAGQTWRDISPYIFLINSSWQLFSAVVAITFTAVNLAFAFLYMTFAQSGIKGAESPSPALHFLNLFFFGTHTLTTVGYGNMYPVGPMANLIASIEGLLGLLTFAIATGLLFGRFSRPSARFGFSQGMVVAPYQGGASLQFRVVNRRPNNLLDAEARVMLMTVETSDGKSGRKFQILELERPQVLFLPLTWTIVHPIDERSPLFEKTSSDLQALQAEVVVMMKGFDETFSQIVYARNSYRYDEITWGAKFTPAFEVDREGDLLLWVDRVGHTEAAPLP